MLATSRKRTKGGNQEVKDLIMQTGLNLFTTRGYFNTYQGKG